MTPEKTPIEAIEHLLHLHSCEQEGIESGMPTPQQWIEAVKAAHEAVQALKAAQSPAISRERLVEIIAHNINADITTRGTIKINPVAVADAILSEPSQPPKPESQPITLPTDEEIWDQAKGRYLMELGFDKGAKWMRSEVEKRMKGGEG